MKILVDNINLSLRVAQTLFLMLGFWAPTSLTGYGKVLFNMYTCFSYMFLVGFYIIIQVGYLYHVWGNVTLMTDALLLLFTNLSLSNKILNLYRRKTAIREMIAEVHTELSAEDRPDGLDIIQRNVRDNKIQFYTYFALSYVAILGWALSCKKGELPITAWYPYDAAKSPAFELTYAHQCSALILSASLNMCLDNLVTSLISQCQCRFKLLSLSLRTVCNGLTVTEKGLINLESEGLLTVRLRGCVMQHQRILKQAAHLQTFFSIPVFGQFSVSMVIICITAYQMAISFANPIWFISMVVYMLVMLMQLFIYCYRGNHLVIESGQVANAAYECPWYACRPAQRRYLLLVMARAQRETRLMAGGLTELSLPTFMAIVKASYTYFTVLQTVEDSP